MSDFHEFSACLFCGADELIPYFDGGSHPPANAFYKPGDTEPESYPLGLKYCPSCGHSQNIGAVDPRILYSNYAYASGTSATLATYFHHFADLVEKTYAYKKLRILEIACNDGSLLKIFQSRGHKVLGVDPAANLNDGAVPIVNAFWNEETLRMLPTNGGIEPFDVIIAMNVLGHTEFPLEFLRLAKHVLAPTGRIWLQTSQAKMVEECQVDTAYAEHCSFPTTRSFVALARRAGLHIRSIEHVAIHGTSYLVEMTNEPSTSEQSFTDFVIGKNEKYNGYYSDSTYAAFAPRVAQHAEHVRNTVELLNREGFTPILYGAAAKAVNFSAYAGLKFALAIDDAPLKQGKIVPGLDIQVFPLADLLADPHEKIGWIIGAWTMAPEIKAKIKAARPDADDRFWFGIRASR